jgi:hypothetical protein
MPVCALRSAANDAKSVANWPVPVGAGAPVGAAGGGAGIAVGFGGTVLLIAADSDPSARWRPMTTPPATIPMATSATKTTNGSDRRERLVFGLACRERGADGLFVVVAISPSITASGAQSTQQDRKLLITMPSLSRAHNRQTGRKEAMPFGVG